MSTVSRIFSKLIGEISSINGQNKSALLLINGVSVLAAPVSGCSICYAGSSCYFITVPFSEDTSNIGVEYYPSDPALNAVERTPLFALDTTDNGNNTLSYFICSSSTPNIYTIDNGQLILWIYSFSAE
jgi:hypothetical protein